MEPKQQQESSPSAKDAAGSGTPTVSNNFNPEPKENWQLISQGAEAKIWKLQLLSSSEAGSDIGNNNHSTNQWIVCKERFSKSYRHPELDKRLTQSRCRGESKVLEKCTKRSSIRVPKVIRLVPPLLYLEYLDCPTVRLFIKQKEMKFENDKSKEESINTELTKLAQEIGIMIAKLHALGVIHGDLTTSNMMMTNVDAGNSDEEKYELALIDFGLAKSSESVEEKAVDLYVLERAFHSTHPNLPHSFFDGLLKAYEGESLSQQEEKEAAQEGNNNKKKRPAQTTLKRLDQVRARGRKRECFG